MYWNAYNAEYGGQRLGYRQLSANLNLNQSFVLPHGLTAGLSGFYNSPSVYSQLHLGGLGQLSAGVQKSLWNKAATLRLNVSDLFHTMHPTGRVNYGPTNLTFTNRWESRVARLTFTWNFGNQKLKTTRQRRSVSRTSRGALAGTKTFFSVQNVRPSTTQTATSPERKRSRLAADTISNLQGLSNREMQRLWVLFYK